MNKSFSQNNPEQHQSHLSIAPAAAAEPLSPVFPRNQPNEHQVSQSEATSNSDLSSECQQAVLVRAMEVPAVLQVSMGGN